MNRCWHKCDGQVGEGSNNNVRHVTGANILPIFSHNLQVADQMKYIFRLFKMQSLSFTHAGLYNHRLLN